MDKILGFIKFTQKEYAEELYKSGRVFFNLPQFYNDVPGNEQGDTNEGAEWIDNSEIINIRVEHPTIGSIDFTPDPNSPSKLIQYNYHYLSFSIYALTSKLFDNNDTHTIDPRLAEFGDTAVIIEDPLRFLDSLINELKKQTIEYEIKSVVYKDLNTGRIEMTPFDKKEEHKHQNELRVIIKNTDGKPKSIDIGSIEAYSRLVSANTIIESTWTVKRNESSSIDD